MALAILGVTGFTGRLVLDEARRAGLDVRLVGRRPEALQELAAPGEEIGVADARSFEAMRQACDGCEVVASCAGPFLELGTGPVLGAIAIGAHYLDTSGEQAWVRHLHELEIDVRSALLPAFGFDYVPGDVAARLAAEQVEGPLDEVVVAYSVKGVGTSRGTRRTIGHVMGQGQVAWAEGRLVGSRFGATTRTVQFPFGERAVVEWGGTEPLTVPRHTDVRNVRSYLRAPAVAARAGGLGKLAAPFLRAASRFGPAGPSPESRRKSRFTIVAEARGPGGEGRAVLQGTDPYGLTARLIVVGAQALVAGEARGTGVLAPAEAFDARTLAGRLQPFLAIAE
jgi:short subunit dehydrogenase-like uncharacterized protein